MEGIREDEAKEDNIFLSSSDQQPVSKKSNNSLVIVLTSEDRLEFTLSPGAVETLLMVAEVSFLSVSQLSLSNHKAS